MIQRRPYVKRSLKSQILTYYPVLIALVLMVFFWLLGVPQHSYYYARCGGNMPVVQTASFMKSFAAGRDNGYFVPSDRYYYSPPYLWNTTFYCSEQQAIDDKLTPHVMSDLQWKRS